MCICLEMSVSGKGCVCPERCVYVLEGVYMSIVMCIWLGATFHYYEICCSFPQNAQTLDALGSSIFIQILCCLLHSSDLDLVTTLS